MVKISQVLATAAIVLAPVTATASDIFASRPDTVLGYFKDSGFPSKLTVDNVGDPLVEVKYFGTSFEVYFYGCSNNVNCTSVQFYSGYRTDGRVTLEQINQWNAENRFIRGYVTDEGAARIETDAYTGQDGLSSDDFDSLVNIWLRGLTDFETEIDW